MTPEEKAERDKKVLTWTVIIAVLLAAGIAFGGGNSVDCERIQTRAKQGRLTESDVRLYADDC